MTRTIDEVYFLVRVGTWGQAELDAYIQDSIDTAVTRAVWENNRDYNGTYESGKDDGYARGYEDGKADGYDEGYAAGEDRGYGQGLRDGESGNEGHP